MLVPCNKCGELDCKEDLVDGVCSTCRYSRVWYIPGHTNWLTGDWADKMEKYN
jgi:hypothetical protein